MALENFFTYKMFVHVPDTYGALRYSVIATEIVVNVGGIIIAALFLRVCWPTETIHRNLKVVFYNSALAGVLFSVTSVIVAVNAMPQFRFMAAGSCGMIVAGGLNKLTYYFDRMYLLTVAIERTFATVFADRYEKSYNVTVVVGTVFLPWLLSSGQVVCLGNGLCTQITAWVTVSCIFFISFTIFVVLNHINVCKFHQTLGHLSERYQIAENIKLMPTLRALLKAYLLQGVIVSTINYILIFKLLANYHYYEARLSWDLTYLTMSMFAIVRLVLIALTHDEMRRRLRANFRRAADERVQPFTCGKAPNTVIGVRGNAIIGSMSSDAYFKQLSESWYGRFKHT